MTTSASFSRCLAAVALALFSLPAISSATELQAPGVKNFWKVNEQVYRGAQPSDEGFQSLAKIGVRTVIDLRATGEHSQAEEQRLVEAAGMKYVSVPMEGMTSPTDEQVSRVMGLLNDNTAGPVFVHCQRGADRTGALLACYRIGHDGWESKKALHEARALGMSWYQTALQRYVRAYHTSAPAKMPSLAAVAVAAP